MWKTTAAELAAVTQPVLVFRSTVDHVVGPASMKVLTGALPGTEVRPLGNSYHVATLDNDAPEIFDGTLAFITKHSEAEKRV
jgi:carboxylesterase